MASQAVRIADLVGYAGSGEWYKPMEVADGVTMVEILQVGVSDGPHPEIEVVGRIVDDSYNPISNPLWKTGIVPVSGLNPQTLVYTRS